ncbi:MAG: SpoIIE family protein phosphatase [Firmicutes bacterium]|nr:SpoIIE family protein phosphatase [Bacillota bacterium]
MSPTFQRIRWRLVWTSILALGLSLGFFYLNQWVYAFSDDQCTWMVERYESQEHGQKVVRRRAVIREILEGGVAEEAGLLEGDELLMIRGQRVNPDRLWEAQTLVNDQPEGRILIYLVRRYDTEKRDYRMLALPVKVAKPFHPTQLIVLLTGLLTWALGLLVVVSSPQRKITRHFYYLGLMALMMPLAVTGFMGNMPGPLQASFGFLSQVVMALAPPLWLHFFLRFPYSFPLRTHRRFLVILYGSFLMVGLLFGLFHLLTAILGKDIFQMLLNRSPLRWVALTYSVAAGVAYIAGLAMFWVGAYKLPDRRRRGLFPALLFSTAILVDLIVFLVLQAQAGQSLAFQRISWCFFTPLPLLPLSFAYAVLRHGFFDVQRALLRWITYFVVLGLTLVAYFSGLAWVFSLWIHAIPTAWVGVLMGVLALPIGWLLRWLLLSLRRLFRRDLNQVRDLLYGSLREGRKGLSETGILSSLKDSLREAYRPQVLLMLPVEQRSILLPAVESNLEDEEAVKAQPCSLRLPMDLLRRARENQELVLGLGPDESEWIREQGDEVRAHVDALEAQILVLLLVDGTPHTVFLLGGKYAELNYGREDRELLREVAIAAGTLLETSVLHRRLLDQGRIEQELQTARRIQESLITYEAPCIPGYQMALRLEPALETGGDLLWVKRRPGGKWLAAVGDVSGKGMAAALYMSQAMALLKFAAQHEDMDFEKILPALDRTLRSLMSARDFLTLVLLEWDESGAYRLARAGHPGALILMGSHREDIRECAPAGRGLGLRPPSAGGWQIHEGVIEPGQWIVMYSDGLTEAMNKRGELYGAARLEEQLIRMRATGSARAACEAIYRDVAAFENQNRDDRTLFILARDA